MLPDVILDAKAVLNSRVWVGCVKGFGGGPQEEAQEGVKEGCVCFSFVESCSEGSGVCGVNVLEFGVLAGEKVGGGSEVWPQQRQVGIVQNPQRYIWWPRERHL